MSDRPLLMIPGPIEITDHVHEAGAIRPPSHLSADLMEAFGSTLKAMRGIWLADADSQPFLIPGGGTLAMDSVVWNTIEPGDRTLVVNTGYFSDRMATMLARRGARVEQVTARVGDAPETEEISARLDATPNLKAVFATHVDTSTGVRVDVEGICRAAHRRGVLSIVDGVCATAAERFHMSEWGADVYLTASQKALGAPAGLALWVASPRALSARRVLATPPPLSLDWDAWRPIMSAYEEGSKAYFSTPATTLVPSLHAATEDLLSLGPTPSAAMALRFDQHRRAADALRAAWRVLGLELLPRRPEIAANTLSTLRYPEGIGSDLLHRVRAHGVIVAGGLHPTVRAQTFRVGHMGCVVTRTDALIHTVRAVGNALADLGHDAPIEPAIERARELLSTPSPE